MNIHELEKSLEGATHANLVQIARDHFTPEFLEYEAGSLLQAARMASETQFNVTYNPSELDKCVVHYASRELIGDLWSFSLPTFRGFVAEDKRFKLDEAIATGGMRPLTSNIPANLDIGREFIADNTDNLYRAWVRNLYERHQADKKNKTTILFTIYRAHSALISGGDWDQPTVMGNTFEGAGREAFDWVRDYPDMSREELEEISKNSLTTLIETARQLGIKSTAREHVTSETVHRGELSYVLDPATRTIIFNPTLLDKVARREEEYKEIYYDQTKLRLMCPALYVPSNLYPDGSMLRDLTRFRSSVYTELYLATHNRR